MKILKQFKKALRNYYEVKSYKKFYIFEHDNHFSVVKTLIERKLKAYSKANKKLPELNGNSIRKILGPRFIDVIYGEDSQSFKEIDKPMLRAVKQHFLFEKRKVCHIYKAKLNCYCEYGIFDKLKSKTSCRYFKIKPHEIS